MVQNPMTMDYASDTELRSEIAERRRAMADAPTKMAADLCQIAIDRLQKELHEREARKPVIFER
jgi:hypothetical protein